MDRSTYIGGSDAAAILGLSPWPDSTPLAAWMRKKGLMGEPLPDPARDRRLRRGKKLESYVVDTLAEVYGIKITKRSSDAAPNRYADPEHPFLAAEIDFEWEVTQELADLHALDPALIGTTQNGEVKTTVYMVAQKKWGEEGTDEIPIEYATQALHGLMVSGRQVTMVACMVGSDDPLLYWVKRDDEIIAEMRGRLLAFWRTNILGNVAPEPVNLPDVYRALSRKASSVVQANAEVADWVRQLNEVTKHRQAAEAAEEEIKFKIGAFMVGEAEGKLAEKAGRHVLTLGGLELLTISQQERTSLDAKGLAKAHPEVAKAFERKTSYYRFSLKRSKS